MPHAESQQNPSAQKLLRQSDRRRARIADVADAHPRAVAYAGRALVQRIGPGLDRLARAVDALPLERRGAGLARPQTRHVATNAVGADAGDALGARRTRVALPADARAHAVANAGRAFARRIRVRLDRAAYAVRALALHRRAASLARAPARPIAADAVDAMAAQAIAGDAAAPAIVELAEARAIARARGALVRRIAPRLDRLANAVRALPLDRRRARLTRAGAGRVAADAVGAGAAQAIAAEHANITQIELAGARAVARSGRAFRLGIGPRRDGAAGAVRALPFDRRRAGLAGAAARRVAADAVDAVAAQALRAERTDRAVVELARAGTITRPARALIFEDPIR